MKPLIVRWPLLLIFIFTITTAGAFQPNFDSTKNARFPNTKIDGIRAGINPGDTMNGNPSPLWGEFNIGFSQLGVAAGVSMNLFVNRKILFTANYSSSTSEDLGHFFGQDEDYTIYQSFNFTAGKLISANGDKAYLFLSAGVSYTSISYYTAIPGSGSFFGPDFDLDKINTIGLPISLKLAMPTHSALGFNLELRADINKEKPLFFIVAGLRIGRILSRSHTR